MQVIDLTHRITPDMPVYPGTEGPRLIPANTYEANGFRETLLSFYSHTGTHMDAPAHLYPDGATLDRFPASHFVGRAVVADCSDLGAGQRIPLGRVASRLESTSAEFLLLRTGWDCFWGRPEYFGDYPVLTEEAAQWLAERRVKGVGLDVIGLDPVADEALTLHRIVLRTGATVIIENLKGLHRLGEGVFTLCVLPLNQEDADGAPIRAVALLDE